MLIKWTFLFFTDQFFQGVTVMFVFVVSEAFALYACGWRGMCYLHDVLAFYVRLVGFLNFMVVVLGSASCMACRLWTDSLIQTCFPF